MTAENIPIADHRRPTEADVNTAWEAYALIAGQVVDNPRLLIDRGWFEEFTRRQRHFQKLFVALEEAR